MIKSYFGGNKMLLQFPSGERVYSLVIYRISNNKKQLHYIFLKDYLNICGITGKNSMLVFLFIIKNINRKTLKLRATNKKIDNLMYKAKYNIANSTINNVLSKMSQKGLIERKHGIIILNKNLAKQYFSRNVHHIILRPKNKDVNTIDVNGIDFNYRLEKN